MIKLMKVTNIDSFLQMADESRGDVLVHMPDGSRCSLKEDNTAREMLKVLSLNKGELSISLTNKDDLPMFIYYMATECA